MKNLLLDLYDGFKWLLWTALCIMMGAWGVKNDPQTLIMTANELMIAMKFLAVILAAIVVIEGAVSYWQDRKKKNATEPEAAQ